MCVYNILMDETHSDRFLFIVRIIYISKYQVDKIVWTDNDYKERHKCRRHRSLR